MSSLPENRDTLSVISEALILGEWIHPKGNNSDMEIFASF